MKSRILYLDGLRGIAATAVVVQHCIEVTIERGAAPAYAVKALQLAFVDVCNLGRFGVALFFLISGMVIPFSFREPNPLSRFVITRFFRLYPAYWLSIALMLAVIGATGRTWPSVGMIVANLTMVQRLIGQQDLVGSYWTLVLELFFYGLCAILYATGGLRSTKTLTRVMALLLGLAIAMAGFSLAWGRHLPAGSVLNISLMFLGTLFRRGWFEQDILAKRRAIQTAAAWLIGVIPIQMFAEGEHALGVPHALLAGYYAGFGAFILALWAKPTFGPVIGWLGTVSYSIYLFHGPILSLFSPLASQGNVWGGTVLTALTLGTTLILSQLTWRFVELPCIRRGHAAAARLKRGQYRDPLAQITVNGRFLGRPITGVERYGRQMISALDALAAQGEGPPLRIVAPPGTKCDIPLAVSSFENVGRGGGHLWEQFHLSLAAKDATLVSLANSGPIVHSRHLVVIHDAAPFRFPEAYGWRYRLVHKLLGLALARVAQIGTVSRFSKRELEHFLRSRAHTIVVIPNGSDHLGHIPPDEGIFARLGLERQRFLLVVGSSNRNKNLALVLDAWQMLHSDAGRSNAKLVVVGAINGRIFTAVDTDNRPDTIFAGRVSDSELAALYARTAAFVFPSRYEGFGIPPLEAMAYNAPVLASDIEPVREVCEDAARYFSPNDKAGLATLMAQMLAEEVDDHVHKAAAHKRLATFNWDVSARILLAVLRARS